MKVPFVSYADTESLVEKISNVILIEKSYYQGKQMSVLHVAVHYLHNAHLIVIRIKMIITEVKTI